MQCSVTRVMSRYTCLLPLLSPITYTNLGADLVLGDLEPGPPLAGQQEDGGGQLHLHTALNLHVQSGELLQRSYI